MCFDNIHVGCPEWNSDCSTWSIHPLLLLLIKKDGPEQPSVSAIKRKDNDSKPESEYVILHPYVLSSFKYCLYIYANSKKALEMWTVPRIQDKRLWAAEIFQRHDKIWWLEKEEKIMHFEEVQRHVSFQ